jgi:potassium/hydrogen antiporter
MVLSQSGFVNFKMTSLPDYILVSISVILLLSILASKISERFGIPSLLLFLVLGMLAGSEGPGGIYFDNPAIAQFIGVVALVIILFSGGLSTDWSGVRTVLLEGAILSTLGVFLTALIMSVFAKLLFGFSFLEGLLLGSIVSSTDAAAVFSILRSKGLGLIGRLKQLLELESGSNDPMAVLLTIGTIKMISQEITSPIELCILFIQNMTLGAVFGYGMGKVSIFLVNKLRLGYEGLYSVLTLSLVLFTYSFTDYLGGNGFLAVYISGIIMGNREFIHKRSLLNFHDGLAWLMQITMFLTLGLLVFPSKLIPIAGIGFLLAGCLMFIARPLSVLLCLLPFQLSWREKIYTSWVGLRGAVPIILATYPFLAKLPQADLIFNIIFFVVLTSVLFQGTSVPLAAKWLQVNLPEPSKPLYPLEYTPVEGVKTKLQELPIPAGSCAAGKRIVELNLSPGFLIVLLARGGEFLVPSGGTELAAGDILLVLAEEEIFQRVKDKLCDVNGDL